MKARFSTYRLRGEAASLDRREGQLLAAALAMRARQFQDAFGGDAPRVRVEDQLGLQLLVTAQWDGQPEHVVSVQTMTAASTCRDRGHVFPPVKLLRDAGHRSAAQDLSAEVKHATDAVWFSGWATDLAQLQRRDIPRLYTAFDELMRSCANPGRPLTDSESKGGAPPKSRNAPLFRDSSALPGAPMDTTAESEFRRRPARPAYTVAMKLAGTARTCEQLGFLPWGSVEWFQHPEFTLGVTARLYRRR